VMLACPIDIVSQAVGSTPRARVVR
jgi:hypothetical protein